MDRTCEICGRKLGWFGENAPLTFQQYFLKEHPEYKNKTYCSQCGMMEAIERPFREAEKEGRRNIIVQDAIQNRIADKTKRLTLYTDMAQKYSYTLKNVSESAAFFGGQLLSSILMTFDRSVTTKDQTNFVNCQYCKTRYDANYYFKCPQCGSPTTLTGLPMQPQSEEFKRVQKTT